VMSSITDSSFSQQFVASSTNLRQAPSASFEEKKG